MTPPPPGAPPLDRPRQAAPWNAPEFRDRRRPRPDADRPAGGRSARSRAAEPARRTPPPGRATAPRPAAAPRSTGPAPTRTPRSAGAREPSPARGTAARTAARTAPGPSRTRRVGDVGASVGHTVGAGLGRNAHRAQGVLRETVVRHRMTAAARRASRRAASAGRHTPVDHRRRLLILLAVIASLFAVLASKVVDLQVLDPGRYLAFGQAQRTDTQVLAAERGSMLDRNRNELAISRPTRSVFVDPQLIEDPVAAAAAVAPLLGLEVDEVQVAMTGNGRFAYLARKVPVEVADQVEALELAGVAFLDESERYLPAGASARSLLGAVDVDNAGMSGLEAQLDDVLTGTPGELSLERNPDGQTIAVGEHNLTPAVAGDDVVLTIDRSIQFEAERVLADQVAATDAKGGIAIVTKPDTGEVLAMANVVTDPDTGEVLVGTNNAAVTTQYEPGSVMKMVTVAAALEQGTISPGSSIYLPLTLQMYDRTFREAEVERGEVTWDVATILAHSSNIGTIKIAQGVGGDALYDYQRAFGFGDATSLGFPNEAAGAVLDPSEWSGVTLPTVAIGQGISVSPLQMLLAYNVVANRGTYVPPKLVEATVDPDGVEHPTAPGDGRRVISEATADQLNVMLREVISTGTGELAAIEGYLPAGKTGTAWKVQPGGGYEDEYGRYHYQSTFVGFVPAEQPALSIYVMIDEPTGTRYTGGATAAPVFSQLGSFALRHLGIAPPATDLARGGVPVDPSAAHVPGITNGVPDDDGRVRAVPTGATTTTVPSASSSSGSGGSSGSTGGSAGATARRGTG